MWFYFCILVFSNVTLVSMRWNSKISDRRRLCVLVCGRGGPVWGSEGRCRAETDAEAEQQVWAAAATGDPENLPKTPQKRLEKSRGEGPFKDKNQEQPGTFGIPMFILCCPARSELQLFKWVIFIRQQRRHCLTLMCASARLLACLIVLRYSNDLFVLIKHLIKWN